MLYFQNGGMSHVRPISAHALISAHNFHFTKSIYMPTLVTRKFALKEKFILWIEKKTSKAMDIYFFTDVLLHVLSNIYMVDFQSGLVL